jgi:nitrile hydratase
MNGVHDMGGMHGFGPVVREKNEPYFHAPWERTVNGLMQATIRQRLFNLDEFRRAVEQMPPVHYLEASYYERWLEGVVANLVEKGILTGEEIERRLSELADQPLEATRHDDPVLVQRVLGAPWLPPADATAPPPRFAVGDAVVTRNDHPTHHTRIPRYVRGKRGTIHQIQGIQTFPDTNAHDLGRHPRMVYSVRFTGSELWGDSAEPGQVLYIDLWESYLRPAE